MDELADLYLNTVTVETYQGGGAYGDTWADESGPVRCLVDGKRRLVRDTHGEEVVSETTLMMSLAASDAFTPGSRVHHDGRVSTVISRKRLDGTAMDLPSHAEVTTT